MRLIIADALCGHVRSKFLILMGARMFVYLQNLIAQWNAWGIEEPFPALVAGLMGLVFISIILTTILLIVSGYISKKLDGK